VDSGQNENTDNVVDLADHQVVSLMAAILLTADPGASAKRESREDAVDEAWWIYARVVGAVDLQTWMATNSPPESGVGDL
jgi:hypothetical protein